jgi:flagellar hook-associated protein 3 FlgL
VKNMMKPGTFSLSADGRTTGQLLAEDKLKFSIDLLNQNINGRYLFSGRTHDVQPVESYDTMMNGDGLGRAGLKTLITERSAADLGVAGLGRLAITSAGATTTVAETMTPQNYGFKIVASGSSSAGITATPLAGPPTSASFTVSGAVANGEKVTLVLDLPDNSRRTIELSATSTGVTSGNNFSIAGLPGSLTTAMNNAITSMVSTELGAASSVRAAQDFFAGTTTIPPVRVPLPALTATAAPTPGTAANTVVWYKGDDDATVSARATGPVSVDKSQVVNLGARANEPAFQRGLAQFAALAATTYLPADPTAPGRYNALSDRVREGLAYNQVQSPEQISLEIGLGNSAMQLANDRHKQMKNYFQTTLGEIEQVSNEEVAASLLTLQTRMQASYQTTSILSKLTLTQYLR